MSGQENSHLFAKMWEWAPQAHFLWPLYAMEHHVSQQRVIVIWHWTVYSRWKEPCGRMNSNKSKWASDPQNGRLSLVNHMPQSSSHEGSWCWSGKKMEAVWEKLPLSGLNDQVILDILVPDHRNRQQCSEAWLQLCVSVRLAFLSHLGLATNPPPLPAAFTTEPSHTMLAVQTTAPQMTEQPCLSWHDVSRSLAVT